MNSSKLQLKLNYKFWIETEEGVSILGEGKWKLLKAIERHGSLKAAVDEMGYAYRQTWQNIKDIEEKLGFAIIEKSRGGEKGGQTLLTDKGKKIVQFFDQLYGETRPFIEFEFGKLVKDLNRIAQ
jgi:molybdate transport system regulatory protein